MNANGDSWDWRSQDRLGPVYDKKDCGGGSWAFSATETLEAAFAIKSNKPVV
jgi:C1A family cysteine protease